MAYLTHCAQKKEQIETNVYHCILPNFKCLPNLKVDTNVKLSKKNCDSQSGGGGNINLARITITFYKFSSCFHSVQSGMMNNS